MFEYHFETTSKLGLAAGPGPELRPEPCGRLSGRHNMGMFSEAVDVICTPSGQPLQLGWAGRHYTVCAEPVRWYERRQWWVEESRAPLGTGPGLVDHEIWRVQVRAPEAGPGEILTLDLSRHAGSGRWRLVRIHDALRTLPERKRA